MRKIMPEADWFYESLVDGFEERFTYGVGLDLWSPWTERVQRGSEMNRKNI